MKFVKTVAEGTNSYAKELFHDEAVLFSYLDGEFEHGSIQAFCENADKAGGDAIFKALVDVVAVE
jgi:hypothetical protein